MDGVGDTPIVDRTVWIRYSYDADFGNGTEHIERYYQTTTGGGMINVLAENLPGADDALDGILFEYVEVYSSPSYPLSEGWVYDSGNGYCRKWYQTESVYETALFLDPETDQDLDFILDEFELFLAEKFSPVLHKHSYDLQQNLEDFERLLSIGTNELIVYNDIGQTIHTEPISGGPSELHKWGTWHWDTYGFGSVSNGVYNLDIDNSKRYEGAPIGQRPLYYHVYKEGDYYYVQYWYYFGMNDIREQLSGVHATWHESDWEHVTIKLTKDANGSFTLYLINSVNFYIHSGGRTEDPQVCWWSPSNSPTYDNIQQGYADDTHTHLHVWLAANSHASYNRNMYVYKRSVAGISYQDRVDYSPDSYDLYFEYDHLINLGEVMKRTNVQCPNSGYYLEYHVYPVYYSKPWLAYVGRLGAFDDPYFVASPSPHMPAYEDISHGWTIFTVGAFFGNDGASWVIDNNIGD